MTKLHFVSQINSFENIIFFKPGVWKTFFGYIFCIWIIFVFRYIYVFGYIVCIWIYFPLHIWIHFLFLDLKLVSFILYFNVIVCFSPITFLCKFSIVTMFYYRSFFLPGDVKTKWKSAIKQPSQICNSLRANHYMDRETYGDSVDLQDQDYYYGDNLSQSSYGSHKNRNFDSRSHGDCSSIVDELRNQEENEKLVLLMMNGASSGAGVGGQKNGILSRGVNEKPHRSVVIDDEDIDAYSPEYPASHEEHEQELDPHPGLLDEEEARLR